MAASCCSMFGVGKYVLLGVLVAGAAGAGVYLSQETVPAKPTGTSSEATGPMLHRIPLSTWDIKDHIETPEMTVTDAGQLFLAWASQSGAEERTFFLSSTNTHEPGLNFAAPWKVAQCGVYKSISQMKGKTITREIRMVPHLLANQNQLHLAWTECLPDRSGVRLVMATSSDGGRTLSTPKPVHRSNSRTTFTSFSQGPDGTLAATWLDNRDRAQQPFASIRKAGSESFEAEEVIHPGQEGRGVCQCCPTESLFTADGTLYVAFRNLEDGYRDMAIARKKPGQTGFEGPFPVIEHTWKFDGCPHDGPAIAVVGDMMHILWMDARTGVNRCYHGKAKLADLRFTTTELDPDTAGSQGNPQLFTDASGTLHAVWEQATGPEPAKEAGAKEPHVMPDLSTGAGRKIRLAQFQAGAERFHIQDLAPRSGAFQTRPTICVTQSGDRFVAWNELDETGKFLVVSRLAK